MNKRHYEHTLPNIRGSLSNTYVSFAFYFRPWATIDWCMWGFSVDFCRVDNPTYTCVSRSVFLNSKLNFNFNFKISNL